MKRLIILGGSGFMGQNLLRLLPPGSWQTVVLDRKPPEFAQPDRFVQMDLRDPGPAAALIEEGDAVLHLAHQGIPADSAQDPGAEVEANLYPFIRLLLALAPRRPGLILYSSTGGQIYGHAPDLPISEDAPTQPISAYGAVKLAMEHYLRIFASAHQLAYRIVRIGNPYGPFQERTNRHGAVPALIQALLSDRPFTVFGRGETIRDYIHIDDVSHALLLLLEAKTDYSIFNIGTGQGTPLAELIQRIEDIAGKKLRRQTAALRATDVLMNALDASRLGQATGWKPAISLDQGLASTWEYLKSHAPR
jgi:UDP-glucose 4-epimerase